MAEDRHLPFDLDSADLERLCAFLDNEQDDQERHLLEVELDKSAQLSGNLNVLTRTDELLRELAQESSPRAWASLVARQDTPHGSEIITIQDVPRSPGPVTPMEFGTSRQHSLLSTAAIVTALAAGLLAVLTVSVLLWQGNGDYSRITTDESWETRTAPEVYSQAIAEQEPEEPTAATEETVPVVPATSPPILENPMTQPDGTIPAMEVSGQAVAVATATNADQSSTDDGGSTMVASLDPDTTEREESRRTRRTSRREADHDNEASAPPLSRIRSRDRSSSASSSASSDRSRDSTSSAGSSQSEHLNSSDVRRTVRRYGRRLQECRPEDQQEQTLEIDIEVTVAPSGRVIRASTTAEGDFVPCVLSIVRDMRFPEFDGDDIQFTYPFRIR